MRRAIAILAAVLLMTALGTPVVLGKSAYVGSFAEAYPGVKGSRLAACVTCHTPDLKLNAYGNDLARVGMQYTRVEANDSDGDGFSNLVEIKALTFPGDPTSKPAAGKPSPDASQLPAKSVSLAVTVYVDGKRLEPSEAVVVNGRTLVPLRVLFEALGAEVLFNPDTRKVSVVKGERKLELTVGKKQAVLNGKTVALDVPAQVVAGRVLVPLRFVSEGVGAQVGWDEALYTVRVSTSPLADALKYAGTESCVSCHAREYNDFRVAGHGYKLRPAAEAMKAQIPLPSGYSWKDISYVVGGYKWKARYLDKDGYIITAAGGQAGRNQYNLMTGQWSDYEAGTKKAYGCGSCHTTGYTKEGNQDGRPGITGSWVFPGIQCEACHGPAADHVIRGGDKSAVKVDRSASLCGRCHVRGDPGKIPASNGFIQHHEQYNELLASPHAELDCVACHDPHKKAEFSIRKTCVDCHSDVATAYSGSVMQRSGVDCVDCHMPFATRSAAVLGPNKGDVRTHLFRINTDPSQSMFTEDGKFAREYVTLDFACLQCHAARDKDWAAKNAPEVHPGGK